MPQRIAIGLLCALTATAAQSNTTVAEIISMVRNSIAKRDSDSTLAKNLHKVKSVEKLDNHILEELESAGAGPKAVAELERLRDTSAALPPPTNVPPFRYGPRPSLEEQRMIINAAQQIAVNYAKSLPDFMCVEVVRRYDDVRASMDLRDTLEIKVTYFDQREDYQLLTVNGRPTVRPFDSVGGATSQGEFGSLMVAIFEGKSKTSFIWDHWTTLRKHPAHVFSFRILPGNSNYHLAFAQNSSSKLNAIVGQHGFIYIDRETNQILRIITAADPPEKFPVQQSTSVLDYDFRTVGPNQFLLPVRADIRMTAGSLHTKNLVEFHGYRKFTGESSITFH